MNNLNNLLFYPTVFLQFIYLFIFLSNSVWRAAVEPGDWGWAQHGRHTAPESEPQTWGVRPTTWPLQSEQKHKETKTFTGITTTQRGTRLVLCARRLRWIHFDNFVSCSQWLIMGFDCVNSCCQLHLSWHTNFYILINALFNYAHRSNKFLNFFF